MSTINSLKTIIYIGILVAVSQSTAVNAEDGPAESCTNAASLIKDDDLEGALEEARWCVTLLEQQKQGQISKFFKDDINGFKGGELEQQQAMGISVTERHYRKGDKSVKVSLSGGASGAANNAFAALASFGMSSAQGKKIRIQKRTAVISGETGSFQMLVTLKSGGMLTFDSDNLSKDEVVTFAKAFPVADLDDSRK